MEGWRRTLIYMAVAQVFSILGFSFVVPFLPLYIQSLGVHGVAAVTLWAALLSGGTALGMATMSPVWGSLADRYGRKIMVVRATFSAAVILGLMGLAGQVWQLLLLRVLQGMFTGTVSASQALVASQSPRDRMGFTLGVMQTSIFTGNSLGPLLGGLLAAALGFRLSFAAAAVLLTTSGLIVLLFVREEARFAEKRQTERPRMIAGLRDALRMPALRAMIAAVFAVQFGVTVVFPILPQFVQRLEGSTGHAAVATGMILTGAGAAGALSSVVVGWFSDRVGYRTILIVAAIAAAVICVPQYFVTATWQLLVLRIADGIALGAMLPSVSALVGSLVPAEKRGTAYGLTASANSLGFAAGPLTAAGVVAVADIRTVFLAAAALLGFIAVWVSTMVRGPEDEIAVPPAAGEMRRERRPA